MQGEEYRAFHGIRLEEDIMSEVVDLEVGPGVDGKPELLSIECVNEDLSPEERKKEEEHYYEEWGMCGYEKFLDEGQIAAIAEGHTIVVRGYLEYWRDYWGEWDAEFRQVEEHKTVDAPTRLLDLSALKDLRTQGVDALEILHRLRVNHVQDTVGPELFDILQKVRAQEERDAHLRAQEPKRASLSSLWLYLLENRAYYAVRGFVRRCLRKVGSALRKRLTQGRKDE